jgi:hypothetical protein
MTTRSNRLTFVLICALATAVEAQDRSDWQSLAQLKAGDRIRLTLTTRTVEDLFQSWTPQQVTAGTVIAGREDVIKIERYRPGSRKRVKTAAIGALIGFGGGFAIGAGAFSCNHTQIGICITRGEGGAAAGGLGAAIGAGIGALLAHQTRELIYVNRPPVSKHAASSLTAEVGTPGIASSDPASR